MFVWSIVWFWFKIEYVIDCDFNKAFFVSLFPSIIYQASYKDNIGCRVHEVIFHFLIFSFKLQYYYPSNYIFDKKGDLIGMRVFPSVKIETIVYQKQQKEIN